MVERKKDLKHFRDLEVYGSAFRCAMELFELSKIFPPEEKYSLTDQIRRSSRSVCSNLAEAWRKRRYEAVFKNDNRRDAGSFRNANMVGFLFIM